MGKGKRACNYISGKKSQCEMLIGGDNISNESLPLACVFQCLFVISGNFCFSFVSNSSACITIPKSNYLRLKINYNIYICACFHFVLIGRNLTAQLTGSHKGIGGGIQIPET